MDFTYMRGRVGLAAALQACGVGAGDLVALQAFTCQAVPEAILAVNAVPLYIDTEASGVNMSPDSLSERLDSRVKAVIVQHTFGIAAEMKPIMKIAAHHGLPLIEDCCHTFSTSYGGAVVGTFGVSSFYSFEWGKPFVVGIGGGVKASEPSVKAELARGHSSLVKPSLSTVLKVEAQYAVFRLALRPSTYWPLKRLFGRLSKSGAVVGNYNDPGQSRAPDFDIAMSSWHQRRLKGLSKGLLKHEAISNRLAARYKEAVLASTSATLIAEPVGSESVYARFPFSHQDKSGLLRQAEAQGIELADWYTTPIHPLSSDQELSTVGYKKGECPNAEAMCKRLVSLPISPLVRQQYLDKLQGLLL